MMRDRWGDWNDDDLGSKFQNFEPGPDTDSYYKGSETTFPETNNHKQRYCQESFSCGLNQASLERRIEKLENRVEELEDSVQDLEETSLAKRKFLKTAKSLLKVVNFILIIIPIVVFAAIAIGIRLYNGSNFWLSGAVIAIGAASLAEYFCLPFIWKRLETRVQEIEDHLKIE